MNRIIGFSPNIESLETINSVSVLLLSVSSDFDDFPKDIREGDALRVEDCALIKILIFIRYFFLINIAMKLIASIENSRLLLKTLFSKMNIKASF